MKTNQVRRYKVPSNARHFFPKDGIMSSKEVKSSATDQILQHLQSEFAQLKISMQKLEEDNDVITKILDELVIRITKSETIYKRLDQSPSERPHRCPICDGSGAKKKNGMEYMCDPCDGEGILWRS